MGTASDHDEMPDEMPAQMPAQLPDDWSDEVNGDSSDEVNSGEMVEFDPGGDMVTRVANAKRRHGAAGAMLAAGMLGIDQALSGRKPREEIPVVVDANSDPVDIDTDGITVSLDHADVIAPALPRTEPKVPKAERSPWRRR
jgi:hypothetical protein